MITPEIIRVVQVALQTKTSFKNDEIAYEIQDNHQHLLISIQVASNVGTSQSVRDFKLIAKMLDSIIPRRSGEYTWMVNFYNKETLLDSYFGGDSDFPDSGL
ncbi:hypothetical protein VI26_08450 [Chromobacterium sp. LK1]|nr:hypothetical protein VI26_08450 [Chromobacterium sp. LK1]